MVLTYISYVRAEQSKNVVIDTIKTKKKTDTSEYLNSNEYVERNQKSKTLDNSSASNPG